MIEAWVRAHQQGQMVGWDFSRLGDRMQSNTPPWDFEGECAQALSAASQVLDMGTGGGERLMALLDRTEGGQVKPHITATEGWAPICRVLGRRSVHWAPRWWLMDPDVAARLPFADDTFDLIMNRHEAYDPAEVCRVLSPGGLFLTQQVDGRDAQELREWFGGETAYPDSVLEQHRARALGAGLVIDAADDWSGSMVFDDVQTLVEYMALVPWDVPDFHVRDHEKTLTGLELARPIAVTQRRFRLTARKPNATTGAR
ncbi:class I SAM-dependent methyltransferase [Ornithinimicrobium sp. INDO-MA30-4]|uniref:class I SAM-dependent methyltransferase n=1 Tax=Ornithinimicrobium sp. INDO-MA30-4 TaxID=2908651 RepID=UPI001F1EB9B7|nr:class I SAM-dependent methyltransferase [Ornithinimicrobium sp. INDO-MA30-4]UJH69597.1 class I SAM-dependent methyltransferase [Ornithinimicrobium sp. INDO-MA30-4]